MHGEEGRCRMNSVKQVSGMVLPASVLRFCLADAKAAGNSYFPLLKLRRLSSTPPGYLHNTLCQLSRDCLAIALALASAGCAMPIRISTDAVSNYQRVFPELPQGETTVLNSRVEVLNKHLFGILMGERNGDWEFEFLVTPSWLSVVRRDFTEIAWSELQRSLPPMQPRKVPAWFRPNPEKYSAWRLQGGSVWAAHLFIERTPAASDRIHVFIRRH